MNCGCCSTSIYYHLSKFDAERKAFYNFDESDGLIDINLESSCVYRDGGGRLFFGEKDGLVWFHPDSVRLDNRIPSLVLTGLELANEPVGVNDTTGILSQSLAFTDGITLTYQQNVFTLRYAALEYLHPEKFDYAFQLEGFDEGWRPAGSGREATYTNLGPGDYLFNVKCQNRHGFESEPVTLVPRELSCS